MSSSARLPLRLIREARIGTLLPADAPDRLEASGVLAVDGRYHVIFDNLRCVALIDEDLDRAGANTLVPTDQDGRLGYEDIARDPETDNLYLLIEAARRGDGYMAQVEEYDGRLRLVSTGWLEFPLAEPNKGFEGLECVHRDGTTYLLGLCEGNRDRGGGRIVVFRRGRRNWKHEATIDLPRAVEFADYSGMSIAGERLAVVSQESSALWAGSLAPDAWELTGPGRTYLFPRDADGGIVYCTVEGVCWLPSGEVVVVSDRAKGRSQGARCRAKDQSLHLFALPPDAGDDRANGRR